MAKLKYQRPKGTYDILPEDQPYWELIRRHLREIASFYGFERIDTPIIEQTKLFTRTVGESTDIVQKEMFSFKTKGGASLTLRPEGTAPMGRAFIENGMKSWPKPIKLYYIGPFFRHEKPQRNRNRQFYQAGLEVLGSDAPIIDALIIHVTFLILQKIGLEDIGFQINSIGCKDCRPDYNQLLSEYIEVQSKKITPDTKKKAKKNPLRLFDSKQPKDRRVAEKAPQIVDEICSDCKEKLKSVLEYVGHLEIPYQLNPFLVRGLDYYTRTVFEITPSKDQGYDPKNSLGGGGRYDNLVADLGGKNTPAGGVALGLDRIIEEMKEAEVKLPSKEKPKVFLVHLGDLGRKKAFELVEVLRKANIPYEDALGKTSLKAQTKAADKKKIRLRLVLAQKEALEDKVILRDAKKGTQDIIPIKKAPQEIKKKLEAD